MKKLIRTIYPDGNIDAYRLKADLNNMGFYAISGTGDTIEVYAIEDDEPIEMKLQKVTEKIIEKHRGKLAYTQWGFIMRKIFMALSLMVFASGCTQWRKLTNSEKPDDKATVENVGGVWGAKIQMNGITTFFDFILIQNGNIITSDSIAFADASGLNGKITGTVSGRNITLTIDEGTRCVNKFSVDGEVNNGQMAIHVTGAGNNIPGTSCYANAVDLSVTLLR